MALVDIISDVSGTICKEEIPKAWIWHHIKLLPSLKQKFKLLKKAAVNYMRWLKDKNPSHFYNTLEGLPIRDFDFLYNLSPNPHWDEIIRAKKPKMIGIVTQDDLLVVNAYLKTQKQRFKDLGVEVVTLEYNFAEYENGLYTGKVRLNVTPSRLPNLLSINYSNYIVGDRYLGSIIKNHPSLTKKFICVK